MPVSGRITRPFLINSSTTRRTVFDGIARPMPALCPARPMMAVLMPISRPLEFEQRAARIAGVDRGIGLDHAAHESVILAAHAAIQAADDAGGQRAVEAERIAQREQRACPRSCDWSRPRRSGTGLLAERQFE